MRRIDKMTAEEAVDFIVANQRGCNKCKALSFCKLNRHDDTCAAVLEKYLKEELPMQKRFKKYDSMKKAFEDFFTMCEDADCHICPYLATGDNVESCLSFWLDEEI